jgi:hypothetical protein
MANYLIKRNLLIIEYKDSELMERIKGANLRLATRIRDLELELQHSSSINDQLMEGILELQSEYERREQHTLNSWRSSLTELN